MWLMVCFDLHPVVAYHYSPSRSQDIPLGLLSDKTQALIIDGYNDYQPACERYAIERLGCWAHARRKFIDAQKALPKGKAGKADQAIAFIQALYRIEAKIKDEPPDKRRTIRQQEAKPIIEKIKVWLDASVLKMLPSSKMGEALTYLQNQWSRLTAYLENGAYPIDNNPAERAIRPFTIGRKNWMFAKNQAGAKASANLYSLIESAKANNVNPYHYLKHVFSRLPNMTTKDDMNDLMPWQFENS